MTMNSIDPSLENRPKELLDSSSTLPSRKPREPKQIHNVILKPNIITRTKRASFQDDTVTLKTNQNIYDSNSSYNENRINNKTANIRLHRHSFSPGSKIATLNSKEKYEKASVGINVDPELSSGIPITRSKNTGIQTANSTNNELQKNIPNSILKTAYNVESSPSSSTNKLTPDTIDKLRQKYSPRSFGYPKTELVSPSKIPVPTPRNSLTKQVAQLKTVTVKETTVNENENLEVPIITEVTPNNFEEVQLIYNHIEFAEPEAKHFIVTRSSSEDSVLKVENSLADFVMEKKPKEKKRSSSFRRILSGGLFGRDKKKKEEDKNRPRKKDNIVFAENAQNESQVFDRHASQRHTVDSSYPGHGLKKIAQHSQSNSGPLSYYKPQQHYVNTTNGGNLDNRYTDMKGNSIVRLQQFNAQEEYVQMDNGRQATYLNVNKFIDNNSSSSNTDSDSRNCTYQNALIAQAELRQIRESENRKIVLQRNTAQRSSSDSSASSETFRSTPPRNLNTVTNVELVKPKALIPISTERPLPNPYRNIRDNSVPQENGSSKTIARNLDVDNTKPLLDKSRVYREPVKSPENSVVVDDIYGTVFDNIGSAKGPKCNSPSQISPKSLEASKLKLPPNREKVELQPRIRSPIPQTKVSTDKIIATELLRNKGSPSRSPFNSIERQHRPHSSRTMYENQMAQLPNAHSTPGCMSNEHISLNITSSSAAAKPPLSPRDNLRANELHRRHKEPQYVTSATIHVDAIDSSGSIHRRNISPSSFYSQENGALGSPNTNAIYSYQIQGRSPSQMPTQTNSLGRDSDSIQTHRHDSSQFYTTSSDSYEPRHIYPEHRSPTHNHIQTVSSPNPYYKRDSLTERYSFSPNSVQPRLYHQPQHQRDSIISDVSYATLQQIPTALNNARPHTPVDQNMTGQQHQKSPQKQQMIQNVEAFYWRELKKLKEMEEQDLINYRQEQFYVYGYAEDPVIFRRSRSVSPTLRRGQRSLSLPREAQSLLPRNGPEVIVEGRPLIDKRPVALPNGSNELEYGQIRQNFQRNPNFVRNTFERTTIGPIGTSRYYEKYEPLKQQNYAPIFKRGSLTSESNMSNDSQFHTNKKVSFSNSFYPKNIISWSTSNGYTQSTPTRRNERELSIEDDVFLPNSPRILQNRQIGNIYMKDSDPAFSKLSVNTERQRQPTEPLYESASSKHVSVSNKVCDIYGQIHDSKQSFQRRQPNQVLHENYGQIRQKGYVYGQLQENPNKASPVIIRQSFDHLNPVQTNFVRGTRLTASVNDMYRRYPADNANRVEFVRNTVRAPNRPLPPVPERTDSRSVLTRKFIHGYPQISDNESGSEAAEVQRILYLGAKPKTIGAIGK